MKTRVRLLRKDRGWSQEQLAAEAKVRTAAVSELETGKGNPTLKSLHKVAAALEVHVLDLFEDARDDPATEELIRRIRAMEASEREALAKIVRR